MGGVDQQSEAWEAIGAIGRDVVALHRADAELCELNGHRVDALQMMTASIQASAMIHRASKCLVFRCRLPFL